MATAAKSVGNFPEITLTLEGIQVRPHLKLLRMSETTFNFYVDGPDRFVLYFTDPTVFGKEFAVLTMGSNSFTTVLSPPPSKGKPCYVWSESELAEILAPREQQPGPKAVMRAGTGTPPPRPMLPPIIIPPGI